MLLNLLINLILTLFLTIIIECFVSFLMGYRNKLFLLVIILMNIITNPIFNYLILLNNQFNFLKDTLTITSFFEIFIVLIEGGILIYVFTDKDRKELLLFSLIINLVSFLLGLIIFSL